MAPPGVPAKTGIEEITCLNCAPAAADGAASGRERVIEVLKIRVQGLPEEVDEFAAELENLRRWEMLEESADYANRGASKLVRRYIEVERVEG